MKNLVKILCLPLLVLGLVWCWPQLAQADAMPIKPNVSRHIYQDRDFFSQAQIAELEEEIKPLSQTKHPQNFQIYIVHRAQIAANFDGQVNPATGVDVDTPAGTLKAALVKHQLQQDNGSYLGLMGTENVLLFMPETGDLSFAPGGFTGPYYSNWNWKHLIFGKKHLLNDSPARQAKGMVAITKRVVKKQVKLSNRAQPVKRSWTWSGVGDMLFTIWLMSLPVQLLWYIIKHGNEPMGHDNTSDAWIEGWVNHEIYDDYDDFHDDHNY